MIRLIAIDIDGTLLDSHGRLPDVHRDALIAASTSGVEVALATGRSFHFTTPVVAWDIHPLILVGLLSIVLAETLAPRLVPIATAEDIILHKLHWNMISPSDRHLLWVSPAKVKRILKRPLTSCICWIFRTCMFLPTQREPKLSL